jgi:hypothetical protein
MFVGAFIGLGQGSHQQLTNLLHTLLHTLDKVFRALIKPMIVLVANNQLQPRSCSNAMSVLDHTHIKVVLGWIIDDLKMTIKLPQHQQERLTKIVASIPRTQKHVSVKKWRQVLGKLGSMMITIQGSQGIFNLLYMML